MGNFNIDQFRAYAPRGFLKPTHYQIMFPIPPIMAQLPMYNQLYQADSNMIFHTDSADLMGAGFLTRNITRYGYGHAEKKPFAPQFNDMMITFYNNNISAQLNYFNIWMMLVQNFNFAQGPNPSGSLQESSIAPGELMYKSDYAVDATFTLLNDNTREVVSYVVRRMWPIQIPETKMGWSITNDIMRITVLFNYFDWYVSPQTGGTLINYQDSQDQQDFQYPYGSDNYSSDLTTPGLTTPPTATTQNTFNQAGYSYPSGSFGTGQTTTKPGI